MVLLTPHRRQLLTLARNAGNRLFDPRTGLCLIPRDTLWYAASLLQDDAPAGRALGQSLLQTIQSQDGTHTPATMLAILHGLGDQLEIPVRSHLRTEISRELIHAAEVQWRDGNVNHPLGAWCTLALGGELTGESWAVQLAGRRLEEFRRLTGDRQFLRQRQAEMSEYNSPTYTALDILFLALIAEYASSPENRVLALFLEQRLWLDETLHFHGPSGQFSGPHSRSYQDDSSGGFSALHTVLTAAMESVGTPPDRLYMNPELCVKFNHPSSLLQCALSAIVPTHIPRRAIELAWEKPFPCLIQKVTYCEQYHENRTRFRGEQSASSGTSAGTGDTRAFAFDDEVYPGGLRDLTTYMTGEYALGTASLPYVNGGHSDGLMLRLRRSPRVTGMADFRSMYTRGVFNGSVLGRRNSCHVTGTAIDESYLYEEGRPAVYQDKNRAIVFYAPKRAGHLGVETFQVEVIFSWYSPFTALMLGGRRIAAFPEEPAAEQADQQSARLLWAGPAESRLYFQDYRTFGAVIPLGLQPAAVPHPVQLRLENDHLIYGLLSYEGSARDFSRDEITGWRTGFVLELATMEEYPDFEAFVRHADGLTVTETVDSRGIRTGALGDSEGLMRAVYDPYREQFISRTWKGAELSIQHLRIEAGPAGDPLLEPLTFFGHEAFRESR